MTVIDILLCKSKQLCIQVVLFHLPEHFSYPNTFRSQPNVLGYYTLGFTLGNSGFVCHDQCDSTSNCWGPSDTQ